MLNILIVAKDSLVEINRTILSLESNISQSNYDKVLVKILYSKSSNSAFSFDLLNNLNLNIDYKLSDDCGVYSAMNNALESVENHYSMFLNSGDIVTDNINFLISKLSKEKHPKDIFMFNSFHRDLSFRKNNRYISRFSLRSYFPIFGMPCEHCCFISPTYLWKIFNYDERLKHAADYKLILNIINYAYNNNIKINDFRNLYLVEPDLYGLTAKKTYFDSIKEELYALNTSNDLFLLKIIGTFYRIAKLVLRFIIFKINFFLKYIFLFPISKK
tara:strand:+ start:1096 stop:1914 length:819 start_codon:yes stop_codon:yes gene_type:complete